MKLIIAIIRPFKIEEVRTAVSALGIQGMTISEAKGFGRQKGHAEVYRGAEYATAMTPKVRLEIACGADRSHGVIETIRQAAASGAIGDGKIFVLDLLDTMRIRTGETGEFAL